VALPEQVRQQSEAAAKYFADLADEGGDASATSPVVPVEPVQPTVLETPVPPAVVTEPPPASAPPAEDYEQKYKTLQGMFNLELPKLRSDIKERDDKLAQMESLMASLQTLPAAPALPATVQISDAEKAEWGDSIEMMRKVSKAELHPVLAEIATLKTALNNLATSLNTSVLPQVRHVAQQQATSATDQFWGNLQQAVPNWQQTNNDPDFQSWLLSVDDLTGHTRQSFLEQAQKALDVNRVIAFFRSYAAASGKTIPTATPHLSAQPNGSASELEAQLAPGRSRGGKPPVNPTAKTYTQADIAKFYDDVRKGVYRGREAERNQIEADIFAANKDNRVVATA
jgi:hypothetical protein